MFKTEDRCKLELQTPGTMKLFGSAKKINKQHKEWRKFTESWSGCSSFTIMQFSRYLIPTRSEVLYTFMTNKSYAYLLNVEPSNSVFLKTYNTDFNNIIIRITDQNTHH